MAAKFGNRPRQKSLGFRFPSPIRCHRFFSARSAVTAITQAQYEKVMGQNPSLTRGDNVPVENVSREDALAFRRKVSEKSGLAIQVPTVRNGTTDFRVVLVGR